MPPFLSIGEFACATGLSVSAVRFYADRGLLTPAHVDNSSGYRSFLPAQVDAGRLVRELRQIDVALRDIERALVMESAALEELVASHVSHLEGRVQQAQVVLGSLATSGPTVVRGDDLCAAIDQVLPFVTTDLEFPHLLTVLIEAKQGSVRLVATDTFRLALREIVPQEAGLEFTGVVAAATLRDIRSELDSTSRVTMNVVGTTLVLTHSNGTANARLLPTEFPAYERFLTTRTDVSTFVVTKADLVEAFETFASNGGDAQVRIVSSAESLTLASGDLSVQLAIHDRSGDAVETVINPDLGLDCARGAIGAEVAVEVHSSALEPVVFRSATDGTYTSFLMPIKVDSSEE